MSERLRLSAGFKKYHSLQIKLIYPFGYTAKSRSIVYWVYIATCGTNPRQRDFPLLAQSEPRCTPRPRCTTPIIHLRCRCTLRSTPVVQLVLLFAHVSLMRCTMGVLLSLLQVYLRVYTLHTPLLPLGVYIFCPKCCPRFTVGMH